MPGARRSRLPLRYVERAAVAVLAAGGCVEALGRDIPTGLALGLTLGMTLPAAVVERWPRAAVATAGAVVFAWIARGYEPTVAALVPMVIPGLAAYRIGAWATIPAALPNVGAVSVALLVAGLHPTIANLVLNLSIVVLAIAAGAALRAQERSVTELRAQARELEALRAAEMRAAVAQERVRIARDVHDVVGHALAAIAVHARVATRRLHRDPAGAERALGEVAGLSTSALADTREAIGHLRRDGEQADLRPAPLLDDLDDLVGSLRASGLAVELRRADADDGAIPTAVQAAAFRIVQESLSNALRHAEAATVTVDVRRERDGLRVEVRNDGRPARAQPASGRGLLGMQERALSVGGSFDAGPAPDGGWHVAVTLPIGQLA